MEATMRHPKRTITRTVRTRRSLHPGRERDELDAVTWPGSMLRVADAGILGEREALKTFAQALGQGRSRPARWAWAFR
jgi:hypothetical protein